MTNLLHRVAVLADLCLILVIISALIRTRYIDPLPFWVLIGFSLLSAINIALILRGNRLQPWLRHLVCTMAAIGNSVLLLILALFAILSVAMLGGGGRLVGIASVMIMGGFALAGLTTALNLFLLSRNENVS